MCQISSIRMQVLVFSWVKLTVGIYVFAIGVYFASSTDLQHAFGLEYLSHGLSLIFLALLSMGLILPHKYAVNKHNRALLMLSFVMDTIVFAELINYGVLIGSYTVPEFPKELQLDCLRNRPEFHSSKDCEAFFQSDRTAGVRLMWASYFSDKANRFSFQRIFDIQEQGTCCGFFPPFKCNANKDGYPNDKLQEGITSSLLKSRVTCGDFNNYYTEQSNCIDFFDFAAEPPIVGGCEYDLGVGFCLDEDVQPSFIGCASHAEDYAVGLVTVHSAMLFVCSLVSLQFMIYSCCMWWKRKESDVFPTLSTETKVTQRYRNVKDQFEVVPKRGLLYKEGFLPAPEDSPSMLQKDIEMQQQLQEGGGVGMEEEEEAQEVSKEAAHAAAVAAAAAKAAAGAAETYDREHAASTAAEAERR